MGKPPFSGQTKKETMSLAKRGKYDSLSCEISDLASEFISKLLVVDESQRLSASDAL